MQKIYFCFLIFFFALSTQLSAQEEVYTIQGKVSDSQGPLAGVTVSVKGKIVGTLADADGKFTIKANRGDWLVFSFIGFKTQEWLVTEEKKDLEIMLARKEYEIEDVVVTGMGTQRKISSLAAISTIDPQELQVPSPSIANMLGGRVAGVISMVNSGEPGKNLAEFWIRGRGTFGAGGAALVLIDGLEGDINSIDPADIASFSVLKDASATALYGIRGANGVLVITTKRGQSGKLSITARANVSLSQLRRLPKYLGAYDYALLANEAYEVRNEDPLYSPIELQVIQDGLDPDLYPDVNWQKEIVRKVSMKQNYYVSARGGGDIARYFASLTSSKESAAYKAEKNNPYATNTGYNTYSLRLNLDINLTKSTVMYIGSEAFMSINNRPGQINTDYIWWAQAAYTPLLFPVRFSNGQLPSAGSNGDASPYMLINHTGKSIIEHNASKFTIAIDQDLSGVTQGLTLRVQGAYDRDGNFTQRRYTYPAQYRAIGRNSKGVLLTREIVAANTSALYSSEENQFRKYRFETRANYSRVFAKDHRVGAVARFEIEDAQSTNQSSADLSRSLSQIPKRYLGLSGQVDYGFRDTYLVAFNFGYNGTENFVPGEQYGFFPSISLGWIPSSYEWARDNYPWIDLVKIRGSYGSAGNDVIGGRRFPYLNRVRMGSTQPWESAAVETIGISLVGAQNLKWEREMKSNLGVDLQFLKNKLTFTVDVFSNKRDGIFQPRVQIPDYVGLINSPYGNIGAMKSWGSDGNVSYTHVVSKDMNFTIRGNFTITKNKIVNYEKLYDKYPYQDYSGLPAYVWRGYQCLGFFKDEDDIKYSPKQSWGAVMPGDLKYKDINGDGVINSDDAIPISYEAGRPDIMYGIGGTFNYKNISVGVLFKGTGKTDYFRNNRGYIPFRDGELGNILTQFNDPSTRWIPKEYALAHGIDPALAENPNAQLPRLQYGYNTNNSQLSDFWKGNAKYIRLQEVVINYNLKTDFLKRNGLASVDLQLVGNNLYVWDKVKDFDPEQAQYTGQVYPIPTTYSLQVYVNF